MGAEAMGRQSAGWPAWLVRKTLIKGVGASEPEWSGVDRRPVARNEIRVVYAGLGAKRVEIGPRWKLLTVVVLIVAGAGFALVGLAAVVGLIVTQLGELRSGPRVGAGALAATCGGVVVLSAFGFAGTITLLHGVVLLKRREVLECRGGWVEHRFWTWRGWRMVRAPVSEVRYTTIGPMQPLWDNGKLSNQTGVVVRAASGRMHVGVMCQGAAVWELMWALRVFERELRIVERVRRVGSVGKVRRELDRAGVESLGRV